MEDERFLLAVLVHQPGSIEQVLGWLRPEDFTDPGHGQLYRCLAALHHHSEPVAPLTALWEAQRRGLLADGTLWETAQTRADTPSRTAPADVGSPPRVHAALARSTPRPAPRASPPQPGLPGVSATARSPSRGTG